MGGGGQRAGAGRRVLGQEAADPACAGAEAGGHSIRRAQLGGRLLGGEDCYCGSYCKGGLYWVIILGKEGGGW